MHLKRRFTTKKKEALNERFPIHWICFCVPSSSTFKGAHYNDCAIPNNNNDHYDYEKEDEDESVAKKSLKITGNRNSLFSGNVFKPSNA